MMPPIARIAGSMAYRAQMQCVLRSVPAQARQMSTTTTMTMTATTKLQPTLAGQAHTQMAQYRPFSVSVSKSKEETNEKDITATATEATASESAENALTDAFDSIPTENSYKGTPEPAAKEDDVPWYLKVNVPKHETLTPQTTPLPDIPANSPILMDPLVTFAADDLGLDDLKILDLRGLDPPAGLGPDLIMLFSTARSERHLHVSADRLVRWFRKYGVQANADGLLGRNELKIKLKRKARRAKLLGNISQLAAGTTEEVDDGISTKWVCVNAGFIGGRGKDAKDAKDSKDSKISKDKAPTEAHGEQSVVDAKGRTSGFGSVRSAGTTVVVQIFTEGKRKQMELEQLWTKALWHSLRKRRSTGEDVKAQLKALEVEMKMTEAELNKENEDWLAGLPSTDTFEAEISAFSSSSTAKPAPDSPLGSSF
ncbi:atp25 neucr ame full atpase synthesis protein mitochondrial flags precursor [Ophiostoma piceae UAMH 11346]|uniref:ATPase synthesis protein 25 n=1 Tax=Ophiostoma piceae (strain UAMH 11346) TaxID=1262450 RepID=S3C1J3_OPHP1|nr:atp25 neucr ame full atpase synthesis protein mitochondrial flags precursor [Ophiostoma piceae UAMH 11346]